MLLGQTVTHDTPEIGIPADEAKWLVPLAYCGCVCKLPEGSVAGSAVLRCAAAACACWMTDHPPARDHDVVANSTFV